MCEKCGEIDARIARYRELSRAVLDNSVLESIEKSIVNLESEKLALHPKSEK